MGTEILTWMLVIEQSGNRGMGESVPRSEAEVIRRIPSTRVALLLEGNPQRRLEPPPPSPPPSATAAPVPPSHLSPPPSPLSPPPSPLPLSHHTTTPTVVSSRRPFPPQPSLVLATSLPLPARPAPPRRRRASTALNPNLDLDPGRWRPCAFAGHAVLPRCCLRRQQRPPPVGGLLSITGLLRGCGLSAGAMATSFRLVVLRHPA
jgi:hypothetical protein